METSTMPTNTAVLTPAQLLAHWQNHRKLTRRVIEAFPEDQLFSFSIGGMRPFAGLAAEMILMAAPSLRGVATSTWEMDKRRFSTKTELLQAWDAATEDIDHLWPTVPPHRFQEVDTAFGQWTMPGYDILLYAIDNEVHHRGQGYVYLRALGIEPPPFYDRY